MNDRHWSKKRETIVRNYPTLDFQWVMEGQGQDFYIQYGTKISKPDDRYCFLELSIVACLLLVAMVSRLGDEGAASC